MSQAELTCLRCKAGLDYNAQTCPHCGDKITDFQRNYASRLIDGKYQILDRLGIGGMGEIFKVRHIHLGELRVIKIMRPNIASDEGALQRFLHEAKLSTMVKHRNLAMLYDFSTLDDGSYYMVWEFIDGTNIQKWIQQNGPTPPRLGIEMAIQALSGLEALHQMGIIHRDISPENIMLSQDHMGRLATKVIDFGIAKQLDDTQSGQGLTQTGMFLGKLKYASPEQAGFIKEGEHLDARSDLYTFGVVFYEMLAGRAPFLATNPHGYILKHATEKPLPISEVNPEVSIPPKLEAIVMKSLEKDRNNRQASCGEFIAELEAIRQEITPDKKFGLGERMVTLSAQKTEADAPRPTMSGRTSQTGMTKGSAPTQVGRPGGTRSQADQATIIERKVGKGTLSDSATVIERVGGSTDATVVERMGGAAPTLLEPKVASWDAHAAPTTIERMVARPKKKSAAIMGIAAAIVVALAIGGYLAFFKPKPDERPPIAGGTSTTTATQASIAGTSITSTGYASGEGAVLLTAYPWGTLEGITDTKTNKPITLSNLTDKDIPMRLELPAGEYNITFSDPTGAMQRKPVTVEAGKNTALHHEFKTVNYDEVVTDIMKQ